MNSFGRQLIVEIFGESHGKAVGVVINGVPPGITLTDKDFTKDLKRRQGGKKGTTPRKESDMPDIISGVFQQKTTGSPLCILFKNKNIRSKDYEKLKNQPRPGHADFVALKKYNGFNDYRGGGHFSGRLTVCLVAAGVVAKKIINQSSVNAKIVEVGGESDIEKGLQKAIDAGDSVGGIVNCQVSNVPIGWGEPFFDSIEGVLAHAVFAVPAVKGIEFGSGFKAAKSFGSINNDAIQDETGTTKTNNSGGISGGITNGNTLAFDVAFKPTSSTPRPQKSYNLQDKEVKDFSVKGRHDLCIALRAPVVVEAVTAIVLADFKLINGKAK